LNLFLLLISLVLVVWSFSFLHYVFKGDTTNAKDKLYGYSLLILVLPIFVLAFIGMSS